MHPHTDGSYLDRLGDRCLKMTMKPKTMKRSLQTGGFALTQRCSNLPPTASTTILLQMQMISYDLLFQFNSAGSSFTLECSVQILLHRL